MKYFLFVNYNDGGYRQVLPDSIGGWDIHDVFYAESMTIDRVAMAIDTLTPRYALPSLLHFKVQPDHRKT